MKAARPALGLADLGASLFERLVLEVVALEQFSLFFRELLNGCAHAPTHLLELDLLVSRQRVVRNLKPFGTFQAGREHHRQARDGA